MHLGRCTSGSAAALASSASAEHFPAILTPPPLLLCPAQVYAPWDGPPRMGRIKQHGVLFSYRRVGAVSGVRQHDAALDLAKLWCGQQCLKLSCEVSAQLLKEHERLVKK